MRLSQTIFQPEAFSSRGEQRFQVSHEICLGTAVSNGALHFAGNNIEGGNQGLRAVADIFELAPFYLPWLHGQGGCGAFKRLNAGHLIDGNGAHAFLGRGRCFEIGGANTCALGFKIGVRLGG